MNFEYLVQFLEELENVHLVGKAGFDKSENSSWPHAHSVWRDPE
jgi:hypothetical protein